MWKVDARDGRIIWHYYWRTRGGTHIGHRGAAIWRDTLFVETIDDYLVALDAKTGKEKWFVEIADFEQQYFSTVAPVVVDNHVLVGTGNDLDAPGFLQSFNAETGKLEWKFYTVPMNPGDPGTRDVAEPRRRATRRRASVDVGVVRSRDAFVPVRHRQSDSRVHRRAAAGATTCLPARSSRSMSTQARWCGTSRRRHTTRTTGTRRSSRCSSTPSSTASRASSCRPRRATATSTHSIA